MSSLGEEFVLNNPPLRKLRGQLGEQVSGVRTAQNPILDLIPVSVVAVFNNAANPNVGKRERLRQKAHAASFHHFLLVDSTVETSHVPVRMNGPGLDALDACAAFMKRDSDVAVFLAVFLQDFDPVEILGKSRLVVGVSFAVEDDSRGAGIGGIVCGRPVGLGNFRPLLRPRSSKRNQAHG